MFPVSRRKIGLPWDDNELTVLSIAPMEIFSAKAVALLNRAAPRDLYDMFNLKKLLFDAILIPFLSHSWNTFILMHIFFNANITENKIIIDKYINPM